MLCSVVHAVTSLNTITTDILYM